MCFLQIKTLLLVFIFNRLDRFFKLTLIWFYLCFFRIKQYKSIKNPSELESL